MKKLITIILILALLIPAAALSESYSPALNMTMNEFIIKYNAVQAALNAPFSLLEKPYMWTQWNGYSVAWFRAEKNNKFTLLLMTKDPSDAQMLTSGLDRIEISITDEKELIPLISVTNRCAGIFSYNLFGTSLSGKRISDLICYYYENNYKEKDYSAYVDLDEDGKIALVLFYSNGFIFQIYPMEEVK